jgi:hypothetical protein
VTAFFNGLQNKNALLKSAAPPGQSSSAGVLAYMPKTIKKETITTDV